MLHHAAHVVVSGLCLILAGLVCGAAGGQEALAPPQASVDQAVQAVRSALVRIHVVSTDYADGRELKYESVGSGVIVTPEGHVVTNHHVAGHATRLFCTLADKEELEADLVGADPLTDIAVIRLKPKDGRVFAAASFGDSSQVKVGDRVLAMGSPMALSQSVTLGIVSNSEVVIPEWLGGRAGVQEDGEDVGSLVKWIGHDADIAPGNSGGPLVDSNGSVVGINEMRMGLGAAIPGNLVWKVAQELIATGKVTRAWLGLSVQPRLQHSNHNGGVLVSGSIDGSPAALAGIRAGDLLLALGGVPVDVRFHEQLPEFNRMVAELPLGQEVEVVVMRDGQELRFPLVPVERESVKPREHELKKWGLTASNISLIVSKEMKRKDQNGVLVTSVRSGGPAGEAKPAISPRDILVEVDGKPVNSIHDLTELTEHITRAAAEPTPVLALFERKTERFLTVVKVGIKELPAPGAEAKKAWLPIETQVITRDMAALLGDANLTGFRVTAVYPRTTAERAGLTPGDLLLAVDDEQLTASAPEHYEELSALIRQYRVGDVVTLTVRRAGEQLRVPVELVRGPLVNREMKEYRDNNFELTVRDVSFFDRAKEQWPEEQAGVLISDIKTGGWAALGKLNQGDLVLAVDDAVVTGVDVFESRMKQIAAAQPDAVVFKVLRGIYTLYVELKPKWDTIE